MYLALGRRHLENSRCARLGLNLRKLSYIFVVIRDDSGLVVLSKVQISYQVANYLCLFCFTSFLVV